MEQGRKVRNTVFQGKVSFLDHKEKTKLNRPVDRHRSFVKEELIQGIRYSRMASKSAGSVNKRVPPPPPYKILSKERVLHSGWTSIWQQLIAQILNINYLLTNVSGNKYVKSSLAWLRKQSARPVKGSILALNTLFMDNWLG